MSEPQEIRKPNRFRITSIIVATVMLAGAFAVLIGPFTTNVSAITTETWNQTSGNLASTDANWLDGTKPVAGVDTYIVFDSTSTAVCTWDLGISVGIFTMAATYSGTVTLAANLAVTDFVLAGGTWTGSTSYWLTDSGSFTQSGGSGISAYLCQLEMTGAGASLTSGAGFWNLIISGSVTTYNSPRAFKLSVTGTLTTSSTMKYQVIDESTFSNTGVITGTNNFIVELYGDSGLITFGVINCPLLLSAASTVTEDYVLTLANNAIMGSYINIASSHASRTVTVDLAGYSITTSLITVKERAVLKASQDSIITGYVVMNGASSNITSVDGKSLTINGNLTVNIANIVQLGTLIVNGRYVHNGVSAFFAQGGDVSVYGDNLLYNGNLTGTHSYWWTTSGNFNQTGGNITGQLFQLAMTGIAKAWNSPSGLWGLNVSGSVTIADNPAYITSIINSGIMTLTEEMILRVESGTSSFSNTGTINGSSAFIVNLYTGNFTIVPGTINSPLIVSSDDSAIFDQVLTLDANTTLGSSLTVYSNDPIYTCTLDLNDYSLSANGITLGARGVLNGTASTITNSGNWSNPDELQMPTPPPPVIIEGGSYWLGPANTGIQASDGTYLAFIRNGTSHVAIGDYANMDFYTSIDALTWTYDSTLLNISGRDVRNYATVVTDTGRVIVFFSQYDVDNQSGANDEPYHDLHYIYSDDNGTTWSASIDVVCPTIDGLIAVGATPYDAKNFDAGRIGVTYDAGNTTHSQRRFAYSDDDGSTWHHVAIGPVTVIAVSWYTETAIEYIGNQEAISIARHEGESDYAMFTTTDNGETWDDRGLYTQSFGPKPPTMFTYMDVTGEPIVVLLFIYYLGYYAMGIANSLMTFGASAWSGAILENTDVGVYASCIMTDPSGLRFFLSDHEPERNVTRTNLTLIPASGVFNSGTSQFVMVSNDTWIDAKNNSFYDLVISASDVRIYISNGGIINNLTIGPTSSANLANEAYVGNTLLLNGTLVQAENRLNISGNSSTPIMGYGVFDGNIYLNGSSASSYQIQTGFPMGNFHTDRDTTINIDPSHSLRVAPSTNDFFNISMSSLFQWTIQSLSDNATVTFTLSGLESGRMYRLYVDGVSSSLLTASGSGVISFTYSGPWSEHQFEIVATSITGSISPLVNLIFIMFGIGVVVGVVAEGTSSLRKMQMRTTEQMMKSLFNMVIYIVIGMASLGVIYTMV